MRGLACVAAAAALAATTASQDRAQDLLRRMSLEEKAGRLLMAWSDVREQGQAAARQQLFALVREGVVGGVVLSRGHREEARRLIEALQGQAPYPLLVAGDFETGLSFRLQGTTHLGTAMLVGATGLSRLAQDAGRITAVEGRALGFHVNFGPVLDVSNNPNNPVIHVRSFGGDPAAVARLGAAYISGLESAGMVATAKHFPGHGDVTKDSHHELPTVPGDRRKLDQVELVPFRTAIRAGVSAIMTAHLAVPGLGERCSVPATLSRKVLGDVLRKELGFGGVIVTDALDMGGITQVEDPHQAALRAFEAGADLLLMPKDAREARQRIVAAVRQGRLPRSRLDESVLRLLRLLERPVPKADPDASIAAARTAAEIARRGLTLVKDDKGLLPLRPGERVALLEQAGSSLAEHLARQGLKPVSGEESAQTLIVTVAKEPLAHDLVAKVLAHPRAVVLCLGNPYQVRHLGGISTCVCAYDEGAEIESALALALVGRQPFVGRLPVAIPGLAERGAGLSVGFRLSTAVDPETEGLAKDLQVRIRRYLQGAIADRVFPGAVALVTRRGRIVAEVAVGRQGWEEDSRAVTPDTVYDLASLTKVCATLPAVLTLVAEGKLGLDDRVQDHLPAFSGRGKDKVTVRHLMAHCSGLPAHEKYYLRLEGRDNILRAAEAEPLTAAPGARTAYSDLGVMLLMAIIEKVSEGPFEKYVAGVLEALGMSGARFARVGKPIAAAPTEDCPWRHRVLCGEVHDENAWAMGGVSSHAGLFARARDVACLGNVFLAGGGAHWPAPLARQATRRAGLVPGSSRALLWDTFVPGGSGGSLLSVRAFGHTGFCGTSVWCDPRYDLCMVLLTNRVHPTRESGGRTIAAVRRGFHDLVVRSLEDREAVQ